MRLLPISQFAIDQQLHIDIVGQDKWAELVTDEMLSSVHHRIDSELQQPLPDIITVTDKLFSLFLLSPEFLPSERVNVELFDILRVGDVLESVRYKAWLRCLYRLSNEELDISAEFVTTVENGIRELISNSTSTLIEATKSVRVFEAILALQVLFPTHDYSGFVTAAQLAQLIENLNLEFITETDRARSLSAIRIIWPQVFRTLDSNKFQLRSIDELLKVFRYREVELIEIVSRHKILAAQKVYIDHMGIHIETSELSTPTPLPALIQIDK